MIRLTRVGKANSPRYRVVVADKRKAVKRKFIEIIGHYNPTIKPKEIVINKERALFWIEKGAQPSDTVRNLMCDNGILAKSDKVNKKYAKKMTKKAMKEGASTKIKAPEKAEEEVKTEEKVKIEDEVAAPAENVPVQEEQNTEKEAQEIKN